MKVIKSLFLFGLVGFFGFVVGSVSANSDGYGYGYTSTSVKGTIVVSSKTEAYNLKKQPLLYLVEKFGYDRKKDRIALAAKVGISAEKYKGTKEQNLLIHKYFEDKIIFVESKPDSDKVYVNANLPTIKVSLAEANKLKYHTTVSVIAKVFGYEWSKDRFELAKKLGISNYSGTREQNMKIRKELINNIIVK